MLSDLTIDFSTLLRYSAGGTTKKGLQSLKIGGRLKNGSPNISKLVAEIIKTDCPLIFNNFFGDNTFLVPMPRSAPLTKGATWPAKIICQEFLKQSLCADFGEILVRKHKVPKSSFQTGGDNRPSIQMHYDSFKINSTIVPYENIIVIDDVLTLGRTSTAAVMRLKEHFPNHNIKVFSVMRTRSRVDENIFREPEVGKMQFRTNSGKVQMPD
jgi:predicted amidophosphoribosyltransferase